MADEINERGGLGKDELRRCEEEKNYPAVAQLGRVIDADTRLVVVDPKLAERVEQWEHVTFRDLLAGSVQLWSSKIEALRLEPLRGKAEAFRWSYEYDPAFLGIMKGVLCLRDLDDQGLAIV